ncbi:Thymidylate kinase [Streptomyces avidinii]
MLLALEGIAGAGKSTLRDRLLATAHAEGIPLSHIGQFSWLSHHATHTLIRLRAGRGGNEQEAIEAAAQDLSLHSRFNIAPALTEGPVLADRLTLSTACLLALLHQQPVDAYVERLAEQTRARPQLTVLLTTDPAICHVRITRRATERRFTERPEAATRLADLYNEAADAWTKATGLPVLKHPCTTHSDLEALVDACMEDLRSPGIPTAPNKEASR